MDPQIGACLRCKAIISLFEQPVRPDTSLLHLLQRTPFADGCMALESIGHLNEKFLPVSLPIGFTWLAPLEKSI